VSRIQYITPSIRMNLFSGITDCQLHF
jgi:hypothetical protein